MREEQTGQREAEGERGGEGRGPSDGGGGGMLSRRGQTGQGREWISFVCVRVKTDTPRRKYMLAKTCLARHLV
jgi:hypothetical protein